MLNSPTFCFSIILSKSCICQIYECVHIPTGETTKDLIILYNQSCWFCHVDPSLIKFWIEHDNGDLRIMRNQFPYNRIT